MKKLPNILLLFFGLSLSIFTTSDYPKLLIDKLRGHNSIVDKRMEFNIFEYIISQYNLDPHRENCILKKHLNTEEAEPERPFYNRIKNFEEIVKAASQEWFNSLTCEQRAALFLKNGELKENTKFIIREINLNDCLHNLDSKEIQKVFEILKQCPNLKSLYIARNNLGRDSEVAKMSAKGLEHFKYSNHLERLDLSDNNLSNTPEIVVFF